MISWMIERLAKLIESVFLIELMGQTRMTNHNWSNDLKTLIRKVPLLMQGNLGLGARKGTDHFGRIGDMETL
jgi:hypothetical protein